MPTRASNFTGLFLSFACNAYAGCYDKRVEQILIRGNRGQESKPSKTPLRRHKEVFRPKLAGGLVFSVVRRSSWGNGIHWDRPHIFRCHQSELRYLSIEGGSLLLPQPQKARFSERTSH